MQLNNIQKSFKDHMFSEVSSVEAPENEFAQLFDEGDIPLETRLKIYRNHIVTTLSDVLVMNFPLVEILTGEGFLKTAAKLYLFDNPPQQACLDRYGASFPSFIDNYDHAKDLPYLADIARLDWEMNEARIAKQDETLTVDDLAQIDPNLLEAAVFKVKRSVRLLQSEYTLDKIYHFCEQNAESRGELSIDKSPPYILVTRMDWDPKIFKLDEAEYGLLAALQKNVPLGECLEETLNKFPDFNFGEFFQNYIGLETFSEILTNES